MFLLIFLIQTGIVATLVGKTSFSPLVWPQCPVFIRKMGKNIEFQWKKMENQLRWLFHMWITYKVRNILQSKYHTIVNETSHAWYLYLGREQAAMMCGQVDSGHGSQEFMEWESILISCEN